MDSMSQCSEDEVLVNEVVDRTPDTSSDLPSSCFGKAAVFIIFRRRYWG